MRTRERIADKLLKDLEAALARFKCAQESEKSNASAALQRALERHNEFVVYGKVPEDIREQLSSVDKKSPA
jgi:hypothetical protein